jgi:transcriptional regulator with XRE-family HTH domain
MMALDQDDIGERLKTVRKASGLTILQFEDTMHLTMTTFYRFENGQLMANVELLHRFAEHFKVELEWLLTGRGQKKRRS